MSNNFDSDVASSKMMIPFDGSGIKPMWHGAVDISNILSTLLLLNYNGDSKRDN